MNISLRADEKIYINGAVVTVDRKVNIELLNDATFLLENHVLQAREATTPLRQIYFATQVMLMDPASADMAMRLSRDLITGAKGAFDSEEILKGLETVDALVSKSRPLDAMKALRQLFPLEREIMFPAVGQEIKQVA
jgi:flagellar biosynthesis repressor protein FlbT